MKVMAMAMASKKRPQIEICSGMENAQELENHGLRIDAATNYVYLHSPFTTKLRLHWWTDALAQPESWSRSGRAPWALSGDLDLHLSLYMFFRGLDVDWWRAKQVGAER
jgi:hypothetical protein